MSHVSFQQLKRQQQKQQTHFSTLHCHQYHSNYVSASSLTTKHCNLFNWRLFKSGLSN